MPLTNLKSRSRPTDRTMMTYQERIASLHEPVTLSLGAGQLGKGHISPRLIRDVLDGREVFLGQGAIRFGNKSLLGRRVEVLG